MNLTTKKIVLAALGIALYVAISMLLKIPLGIGYIALDLGYIIFAVYCYTFGPTIGAIVGVVGSMLVSLLSSGMFPLGWMLGQLIIGVICGNAYTRCHKPWLNVLITIVAVALGILGIKTAVECTLYGIPLAVKLAKNGVAAATDAVVMVIGLGVAPKIK